MFCLLYCLCFCLVLASGDTKLVAVILSSAIPLVFIAIFMAVVFKYRGTISQRMGYFKKTRDCIDDNNSQPQDMDMV